MARTKREQSFLSVLRQEVLRSKLSIAELVKLPLRTVLEAPAENSVYTEYTLASSGRMTANLVCKLQVQDVSLHAARDHNTTALVL